jgi:hypothetical protein
MPINAGISPGAGFSDMTLSEFIWVSVSTVAATNQGRPKRELVRMQIATIRRSK